MQPFLKWAGGKRWLVKRHANLFPTTFNRYFEPFLGSGAVYFHITPSKAILSDKNEELINTYIAIKQNWKKVLQYLLIHQKNHSNKYYYTIRNMKFRSIYKKAAQLIYLNRTCWNGLYRVNFNGEFNVPKGTKDKVLLESDDFHSISLVLQNVELVKRDFEEIINMADKDDFVFIDPPYTVKHNNNGFIKYNESLFTWDDQVRLSKCINDAVLRGVIILMTNANHYSIRKLYKPNFKIHVLSRASIISAKSQFRIQSKELIIRSKND